MWACCHILDFSASGQLDSDDPTVVIPVAFCTVLLLIGLICFVDLTFLMPRWTVSTVPMPVRQAPRPTKRNLKFSDVKTILSSRLFWIVAMLCVLYYSAIFPFQKYAANMLQCNLGITETQAADIFRWFPIGAAPAHPVSRCFS